MALKAIRREENKAGKLHCLAFDNQTKTYGVWTLCENYDGKIRGGIRNTWRYIEKGLTKEEANDLYQKRISGKRR